MKWRQEQWNNPSLTDHYLMQIALKLHQAHFTNAENKTLEDMQLQFEFKKPSEQEVDEDLIQAATERSKQRWGTVIAAKAKKKWNRDS